MAEAFDAVVIGSGVVGASTAYHLARLGGLKVCVVERGPVCSGGTARSCAIVRSHYSVPSNTALTLKSLEILADFPDYLEDRQAASGFVNSGYLFLAPEGEVAAKLTANLELQSGVGAETYLVDKKEALARHPLLELDDIAAVAYEPNSGYADPYLTTTGLLGAARAKGAVLKTDCPVTAIRHDGGKVAGVETAAGAIDAPLVVSAIGPWTAALTGPLGLDIPLQVSRHTVLTFRAEAPYARAWPVIKDMTTENKMYFRPATGGVVLVGTGDHGDPVAEPAAMDENVGADYVLTQGGQLGRRMPSFGAAALTDCWVGAYDITPDWNPVIGPAAGGPDGLWLTFGFSGHGFKLAPALGAMLAATILGQTPEIDLAPYRPGRFADGELLVGAYGIGSLS